MATIRDYTLTYDSYDGKVYTMVTSTTKSSYAAMPTWEEVLVKFPNATAYDIGLCFDGCANMVHAPALPSGVTDITALYRDCIRLVDSPVIPGTVTNAMSCFYGCTSLATAPELPDGLVQAGYMFYNCTSLVTGPKLPASLENIGGMFEGCTNLTGNLRVDVSATLFYLYCFRNTTQPITIYGRSNILDEIAATGESENVTVWRPTCTWRTPVTNRVAGSRTTHTDMNRIADNVYLLGGYPEKYGYVNTDFVKDFEWATIVADTNVMADELGVQRVTDSTSYTNLNKMETIHQLYHDQSE